MLLQDGIARLDEAIAELKKQDSDKVEKTQASLK
jgi:hypothetical protein